MGKNNLKKNELVISAMAVCLFGAVGFSQTPSTSDKAASPQRAQTTNQQAPKNVDPAQNETQDYEDLSLIELLNLEVTVHSVSKKSEDIKDVPMSTYVISREELRRSGVRDLYEIFQRVPGFSFYNIDYSGQYGPLSRGIYSIWRFGYSYELLPVFDWGHELLPANFFQSIEVARGPGGGITWGGAAEAGLINYQIRNDLEGGQANVQFGGLDTGGRLAYSYMYGAKLNDKGDGLFVGYYSEQQDGSIQKNAFDSAGMTWRENNVMNPSYVLLGKIAYNGFKAIFLSSHAKKITRLTPLAKDTIFTAEKAELYEGRLVGTDNLGQQMETNCWRLEYCFEPLTGLTFTPYQNAEWKDFWIESMYTSNQKQYTVGLNGDYTLLDNKLNFTFGGDALNLYYDNIPGFQTAWVRDTLKFTSKDKGGFGNSLTSMTVESNAFLQGKYTILSNLKVLAGGRLDIGWRKDSTKMANTPLTRMFHNPDIMLLGPRTALIYSPEDNLNLKYLFTMSGRRPKANERATTAGAAEVKPEHLMSNELNVSTTLLEKLSIDGTFYYQTLQDYIVKDNTGYNNFFNAGGITSYGFEWGIKSVPVKNLIVYTNGSVSKSKADPKESVFTIKTKDGRRDSTYTTTTLIDTSMGDVRFVPGFTGFTGAEYLVSDLVYVNFDVRTILNIPYLDKSKASRYANTVQCDLTLRTKKLWDRLEFELDMMNVFNDQSRLPAFGEHAQNKNGTLAPEGRRIYLQASCYF